VKERISIRDGYIPDHPQLLLSLDSGHATLLRCEAGGGRLQQLTVFETAGWDAASLETIREAVQALNGDQPPTLVVLDGPHIIVPAGTSLPEARQALELKAGPLDTCTVIRDPLTGWQLELQLAIPSFLYNWITLTWPQARLLHKQSPVLRNAEAAAPDGCLMLDLAPGMMDLLLLQQSRVLLSERYHYETPADLLYQLVSVTDTFRLDRQLCPLRITGLIEKQSALYTELYQYFAAIELRDNPWFSGDYPAHFFTTLHDASLCV
jgi:hypothetical protein